MTAAGSDFRSLHAEQCFNPSSHRISSARQTNSLPTRFFFSSTCCQEDGLVSREEWRALASRLQVEGMNATYTAALVSTTPLGMSCCGEHTCRLPSSIVIQ